MLKNLRFIKRKMQMEIWERVTKIVCAILLALILCPLATVNFKLMYAEVSDWFFQLKEKMQAETLPWK